jgi:hypothetical protein
MNLLINITQFAISARVLSPLILQETVGFTTAGKYEEGNDKLVYGLGSVEIKESMKYRKFLKICYIKCSQ